MKHFSYKLLGKRGNARAGVMETARGEVKTPVFMPVGTQGSVKSLSPEDLKNCGAEIILGNTYHLYLRPGDKNVEKLGGLHQFMGWKGPILTDSGGYQVSSLGYFISGSEQGKGILKKSKIDDDGVTFYSHLDGSSHRLTAERSIEIQRNLGADIIMAFDEATPDKGKKYAKDAMERTHKWLVRSVKRWKEPAEAEQALFGIIQGGNYKDLRRESAGFVVSQKVNGVAIGGGSIGQDSGETEENVDWIRDLLPNDKPIYLMGVGVGPEDVVEAVKSGADMFDCVAPTRLARMGHLYSGELNLPVGKAGVKNENCKFESEFKKGRINIGNAKFKLDKQKIDDDCDCYTCVQGFGRAYLHHLFKSRELLYYRLASLHNVRFMVRLTESLREWILANNNGKED